MMKINDLYRRMRNKPLLYVKEDGTISSAIYKDSQGVSVDIDDGRDLDAIIQKEEELHKYYNQEMLLQNPDGEYKLVALLSVSAKTCQDKEVVIEPTPVENINPYHALLKGSETKTLLTNGQSKYLAKNTRVVKSYDTDLVQET